MANDLYDVAVIDFDTEAKLVYQAAGSTLAGTTSERKGIKAKTYNFRKMGKGIATERTAPNSDVIPMNIDNDLIPCHLSDWTAPEYTDFFDLEKINFDEIKDLGMTIGYALGRRDDQLKINAMASGTYNATPVEGESGGLVGTAVGGAGTGLNMEKLLAIIEFMNESSVPAEGRHIAHSAKGLSSLLNDPKLTSIEYNNVKALTNGEIDTFLGLKFHLIAKRKEGGLNKTANLQDGYAWHEQAVGYANGVEITTTVAWVDVKQSWLSIGKLSAGAVIRDIDGIVKYQSTEA